jgi:hypothetical protein
MKYILLIFCLVQNVAQSYAQRFEVISSIGYSQYQMHDLKTIQEITLNDIVLPAKIVDKFPGTLHYSGELRLTFDKFSVGFSYLFLTSGSRISYSDYSGEIRLDLTVINHSLGPSLMYQFFKKEKFRIGSRLQFPLMFSQINEKDYIRLLDESNSDKLRFYSLSCGFFPSIETYYKLSRINLGLRVGYLIDSKGRLADDRELTIYLNNKDYLTTDWSGLHIDLLLSLTIFESK